MHLASRDFFFLFEKLHQNEIRDKAKEKNIIIIDKKRKGNGILLPSSLDNLGKQRREKVYVCYPSLVLGKRKQKNVLHELGTNW